MANPVEVSICTNQGQDVSYLERLLYQFNPLARLKVLAWDDEWKEFTNYAVYRIGPDISQVGSPLVGDLVSMNALRPFTHRELASMGGMEAYEPAAWTSSRRADFEQVWAIPWTADPRVLFYWRDMLEQAGVDEATAFAGIETMEATLEKLQKSSLATPWVLPTRIPLAALQTASSWVWGAGGEFVSQDGKKTRFCEPEALLGWQHYFGLHRFMPPGENLTDQEALERFAHRQAAATMGSLYFGTQIQALVTPENRKKLGVTLPPGPPIVGGSSLVIWAHCHHEREALDMVRYLTSPEVMKEHCRRTGYLPTRLDVLAEPPFTSDAHFKVYAQALRSGRPFPLIRAGGLLENNLSAALMMIWQEVIQHNGEDIPATVESYLTPLARRLSITLSQFEA